MEIGWIVEKLLFGVFFHENSPIDPLESNLGIFEVFSIFYLSSWIDWYVDSVNRLKGWNVETLLFGGNFIEKFPGAPLTFRG